MSSIKLTVIFLFNFSVIGRLLTYRKRDILKMMLYNKDKEI